VTESEDDRLIALEIRVAHYERMIEDMSDMVARQADAIDRLTLQMRRLNDKLVEAADGWQRSPQDERPPPHY
jgi:SlyX protein